MYERMTADPYEGWTDAQIAAKHAAGALSAGRLDLGLAFARIAIEAQHATRQQQLSMSDVTTEVQESGRCVARVQSDGVEGTCWAVATPDPQTGAWVHLDPKHDTHAVQLQK